MYYVIESGFSGQFQNSGTNIVIYNIFLKFSNNDAFIEDYNNNFIITYNNVDYPDLTVDNVASELYVNMTTLNLNTQLLLNNLTNKYNLEHPFKLLNKDTRAVLTEFNFDIESTDISGNHVLMKIL